MAVRTFFWRRQLIDRYENETETAVTVEFHCEILQVASTLRVVDRFIVNAERKILAQENFFDPKDVTNPGQGQLM